MKNALKLLIGAAVISALSLACKKEDEKKNFFSVDGTKYMLSGGYMDNLGQDYGVPTYELSLSLYSDGITPQLDYGVLKPVGSGRLIAFNLFTSTSSVLDARTYTFSYSREPEQGTVKGYYSLNYSHELNEGIVWSSEGLIESGTITVSKSGNEYEINIDCADGQGKSVTGYFKGALPVY